MNWKRASGVLLHPTSLPGSWGTGSLGDQARRFVDWLAGAGQRCWQVLPLVAVDEGGSPYNGLSAMAGNPLLIDLQELVRERLLERVDAGEVDAGGRVDYPRVTRVKERLLREAHRTFREGGAPHLRAAFDEFRQRNAVWLDDYTLFRVLRDQRGGRAWTAWEADLRDRDPAALQAARGRLEDEVERYAFQQFLFDRQWSALREYAAERDIRLIGDIPIFVAHDSADVWANPELFRLDEQGNPEVVSGVPPDYFSETGQRWGNPLYDWDRMRQRGYRWWTERFRRTLEWVDLLRIDHFRGFEAFWEIPAAEETAIHGHWRPGPGRELFDTVARELGPLPVIAEDLGLITPEVEALRDDLGYPGMRVLQFAFDGDPDNPHLPENYPRNTVAYPGTHDNDTAVGWWDKASEQERSRVQRRLAAAHTPIHWAMIEMVLESEATLAVVAAQDLLGLGSDARMNTPGTSSDNWSWRLDEGQLTDEVRARLLELTIRSGRAAPGSAR